MPIDTQKLEIAAGFITLLGDLLGAIAAQAESNQQLLQSGSRETGAVDTQQLEVIGAWIVVLGDLLELIAQLEEQKAS